jgi:hypothetical protein
MRLLKRIASLSPYFGLNKSKRILTTLVGSYGPHPKVDISQARRCRLQALRARLISCCPFGIKTIRPPKRPRIVLAPMGFILG